MSKENGNSSGVWEWDWNAVKRREVIAAQTEGNRIQQEGGDGDVKMFDIAAKVLKRWPYSLDPSDAKSYDELGMIDYKEFITRFWATFPKFDGTNGTPNGS